jgi:hypothetical protein
MTSAQKPRMYIRGSERLARLWNKRPRTQLEN